MPLKIGGEPGGLDAVQFQFADQNFMVKGSMPPCIDHMELLAWIQRADFSEHIQRFKLHGNPLNFPHFDAPNTKFAPTGYRRGPNIISHHYKQ